MNLQNVQHMLKYRSTELGNLMVNQRNVSLVQSNRYLHLHFFLFIIIVVIVNNTDL